MEPPFGIDGAVISMMSLRTGRLRMLKYDRDGNREPPEVRLFAIKTHGIRGLATTANL